MILIKFRNRAKGRLSSFERRPFALFFTVFCKPVYGILKCAWILVFRFLQQLVFLSDVYSGGEA
jgi:hypothetical protein